MEAESKYPNHFSQSLLVFPKIEGINRYKFWKWRFWGDQPWGFQNLKSCNIQSMGQNNRIQIVPMSQDLFLPHFLIKIFVYQILMDYFRKLLISQLLMEIFQNKICRLCILTSSIHFWHQTPEKVSKSIQKNILNMTVLKFRPQISVKTRGDPAKWSRSLELASFNLLETYILVSVNIILFNFYTVRLLEFPEKKSLLVLQLFH